LVLLCRRRQQKSATRQRVHFLEIVHRIRHHAPLARLTVMSRSYGISPGS
jgi:hypothetical protein